MASRASALAVALLAALAFTGRADARPLAPSVDVTAEAGVRLVGETVAWKTSTLTRGSAVEHLAGRTAANELTVLEWSAAVGHWQAQNVTAATRRGVTGPLAAWVTPDGPYTVEHLAGRDPAGHLVVWYRSSQNNLWKVVDVTTITGRGIAESVVDWRTPNGPYTVEHLAGRDPAGNLLVFWWSPAHDWQVVDVSAKTGRRITTRVSAWQTEVGGYNVESLAATDTAGFLDVFSWSPAHDWDFHAYGYAFPSGVTAWISGGYEHLAGARADGSLAVLWRSPGGVTWSLVDVTAATAERVAGPLAVYGLDDAGEHVDLIAGRSASGHLILHWWKNSRDWQALDLTEITGLDTNVTPAAWLSTSGGRTVEHLTLQGADGRLRIVYSFDQPRTLTDAVANEAFGVKRMHGVSRKVLTVLWDAPTFPGPARPTSDAVRQAFWGSADSLRGYYLEQSGGKFVLLSAGVVGWLEADHPLSWYDNPSSPHDKMGAALIAADPSVNFAAYDTNHDAYLQPEELAIVFAHPGNVGGLNRGGGGDRRLKNLSGGDLVLDGVRINDGVEVGIGNPTNWSVVAHELGHLLLHLPDMYPPPGVRTPTSAAQYSLMDGTYEGFHLDPFAKLKLGWAKPRLVFRSTRYTLPDIETRRRVYVLADPDLGTDEYFLVENRWGGTSYDAGIFDPGLGVWHVMEDPDVFPYAPGPPTVPAAQWALLAGDWGRSAIRLIRPSLAVPINDSTALWDAEDYDLVSSDPNPAHPSLEWQEWIPSGMALRSFSPAGPEVGVDVTVPWGPS